MLLQTRTAERKHGADRIRKGTLHVGKVRENIPGKAYVNKKTYRNCPKTESSRIANGILLEALFILIPGRDIRGRGLRPQRSRTMLQIGARLPTNRVTPLGKRLS